jgi:hypothetical protein
MGVEQYLTKKAADQHSLKNYGFFRVLGEVYGGPARLSKLYDEEIPRTEKYRKELASVLAPNGGDVRAVARRWIFFLAPRMDRLEFWSGLVGALTVVMTGFTTLAVAIAAVGEDEKPWIYVLLTAGLTVGAAIWKFDLDKKRFWYRYVSRHLEAIAELASDKDNSKS